LRIRVPCVYNDLQVHAAKANWSPPCSRLLAMNQAAFASAPPDRQITGERNPEVMPEQVSQFSWALRPDDFLSSLWDGIELPAELVGSTAQRQLQFRVGRYCAREAIRALDPPHVVASLPRTASGAPLWPAGMTGSITHTDDFVSAAVAPTSKVEALGIDTERIMTAERARGVSQAVAWPCELAHARAAGCDRLEALTLVFSAKEAIFKCLHASVGRVFDFCDVRIVTIDARTRTFMVRVVRPLSVRFPAQHILQGRFEIERGWIHTGMLLRRE